MTYSWTRSNFYGAISWLGWVEAENEDQIFDKKSAQARFFDQNPASQPVRNQP